LYVCGTRASGKCGLYLQHFFVAVIFSVRIVKKSTCQFWMAHGDITSFQ